MEHGTQSMWGDRPYNSLDYYCKKTYGEKLYKIAIDAGLTCPNRDGTLDTGGCIFCGGGGSGDFAVKRGTLSIQEQLEKGRLLFHGKKTGSRFIAYFQAYTNTYGPTDYLHSIYTEALSCPDVAGISIATRPDCLGPEILSLLSERKLAFPDKFIWIELGLQSIHEETAAYIRRGYTLSVFTDALHKLHALKLPVIVHVILGLPGETMQMQLDTIRFLNDCSIFGVKLQLLHVLKDTELVTDYQAHKFQVLTEAEYLSLLTACIRQLSPDIVIHRLTGDGPKDMLIAPTWSLNKRQVLNTLHQKLRKEGIYQGQRKENHVSGIIYPI